MGINPEEYYHQQKKAQQQQDRAALKLQKHGTLETWQIEQQDADQGSFVRDPLDAQGAPKPNLLTRLLRAITGRR
ncbi:MAG: hypothetical protein SF162_10425 [bacterium]|nr:hypothetical protein [bacterium]